MKKILSLKIIIPVILLISIIIAVIFSNDDPGATAAVGLSGDATLAKDGIIVTTETAADGDIGSLGATSISWPGEIISYGDADITPLRDGQIEELYVKIGTAVSAGQSIGRLKPQQSSLELTALLAEKKQAFVVAQAQAKATKKLVDEAKVRLKGIEAAIYRSRDAALAVAEKEATQNSNSTTGASRELEALQTNRLANISGAQAELAQSEGLLPVKFNTLRAASRALSQRFSGALSINGIAPDSLEKVAFFQLAPEYGSLGQHGAGASRENFLTALRAFLTALNDPSAVGEKEAQGYIQASIKLLSDTGSSSKVSGTALNDLRNIIFEDEQIFLEALKEYKEAQNDIAIKRAQLEKITVEIDRDIIGAESNVTVNEAFLQTTESLKKNQIAQADEEFTKEKASLDGKIAELNRQAELARAEVDAAAAAYSLVETGIGTEIVAPKSGVISALYKKVGDYVSTDTPIGSTSSGKNDEKFVRFRVPVDMKLPKESDEIIIERPGFPLNPKRAKIIGVGISLDENGSYQADARFVEPTDWPANASVRVVSPTASASVLVPFTAIWWNDMGEAHLWIVDSEGSIQSRKVTLGRALGDRIEVEKGLLADETFVSIAVPHLTDGSIVNVSGTQTSGTSSAPVKSEGHGHGDM